MDWIHTIALAVFLGLAAASDLRERRVPNTLVGTFTLVALALGLAARGLAAAGPAAAGGAVGVGLLFVPFALGLVGAGDAKFLGAVGAFVGPRLVLLSFLYGTALGGVLAAPAAWRARHPLPGLGDGAGGATPTSLIPYTVPLGLGTLAALALERQGWSLL
jgi:prepilin peptidase CpaA